MDPSSEAQGKEVSLTSYGSKHEIGKGYLFRACKSKGVSHCHLDLAEAGRDLGRLYSGKSRRLQMCPDLKLLA